MKHGFIKVAAAGISTVVADVSHNTSEIINQYKSAQKAGANLVVFPELALTGYTCGDLFYADALLQASEKGLEVLLTGTEGDETILIAGAPVLYKNKLYNCAIVMQGGKILGVIPKSYLPNYNEFYEMRQFSSGFQIGKDAEISLCSQTAPFGTDILFAHKTLKEFVFGVELCEDLWAPEPPCGSLCRNGATIIANLSASNETVGKVSYRRNLVSSTSGRLLCAYVYASAGYGESTQDIVFSAHNIIAENGSILTESAPFASERPLTITEIDVKHLSHDRHRNTSFTPDGHSMRTVYFDTGIRETELTRYIARNPFVPTDAITLSERAETILNIQAYGLKKRIAHTGCKCVVIGISGGLDSTLAVLVSAKAMDLLGRPRTDILTVTMPCFGTTHRTHSNATELCRVLGTTFMEIPVGDAVRIHFRDIGQDETVTDVTYENCQARERTQVLMDLANKHGGLVIGTGDLSELALGWATYNGDHMSMYGVNTSVPKTLVRFIVRYCADTGSDELKAVLYDILDTPVSPELLPVDESGQMTQKTEDIVGPYELHDFFLYQTLRFGDSTSKIFRLAKYAFNGEYSEETITKWLKTFMRRFFNQQFKRSCMPDGPKVGSAALSPRGDWRMPSDASGMLWQDL